MENPVTRPRKKARGFTLIELVIVIAVISILSAMLVSSIFGATNSSRAARAANEVNSIAQTIGRMRSDTAATTAACLTVLGNLLPKTPPAVCGVMPQCQPNDFDIPLCWNGPYLPNVQNDPWGVPYAVSMLTATTMVTVTSAGPDSTFGTTDDLTAQN